MSSIQLTPRVMTARVLAVIGEWGEATRGELNQYCASGRTDLVDVVLQQLLANLVIEPFQVPASPRGRNQHGFLTVYRLRERAPSEE